MNLRKMTSYLLFVGLTTNFSYPSYVYAQAVVGPTFGPTVGPTSSSSGSAATGTTTTKYDPYKDALAGNTGRSFDGDLEKLEKSGKKLTGGPFLGDYNGLSFEVDPSEMAIKKDEGEQIEFELGVKIESLKLLKGTCEPADSKMPDSVKSLFEVVEKYKDNEEKREEIVGARTETMSVYMEKNVNTNDAIFAQLIAIEYQIEMLNIEIDKLSGSTMFSKTSSDKNHVNSAYNSVATSTLAWKENLLLALTESVEKTGEEAKESWDAGQVCVQSYHGSRDIIKKACDRTKPVETCNDDGCTTTQEPDPVPNSCELLPALDTMATATFGKIEEVYFGKEPRNSMEYTVVTIQELNKIQAFYNEAPELGDGFAWKGTFATCVEPVLPKKLKDNAVRCILDSTSSEGASAADAKAVAGKQALFTKALNDHVSGLGSTPKFRESMTNLFKGQIEEFDGKIANPALRAEIFDEVMTPLQDSITYDRQRLSVYIDTRAKLVGYFESLYKLYTETEKEKAKKEEEKKKEESSQKPSSGNVAAQSTPAAAGGATQQTQAGATQNYTLGSAGSTTNYDQANSAVTGEAKAISSETFNSQLETLKAASNIDTNTEIKNLLTDISAASNSRITTKSLATTGSVGASSAVGSKFAYSNKDKQKLSDSMITKTKKNLEIVGGKSKDTAANASSKAVAAKNSYLGLSDKKKSRTLYAAVDPSLVKAFNTAGEKVGATTARLTGSSSSGSTYTGSGYTGSFGGSSSGGSSSRSSAYTSSTSKSSYTSPSSSSIGSESVSATALSDDQREIRKAIQEARKNEGKYQKTENDSIFEVLTKAHIRNYKKIAD